MPTYNYKCTVCGKIEEKFFRIKERKEEISCVFPCLGVMKRCYSNIAIKIPEGWGETQLDFSKKPSKRKKYF